MVSTCSPVFAKVKQEKKIHTSVQNKRLWIMIKMLQNRTIHYYSLVKNSQIFHIYGSFFHMKGKFESYLCIFYKCVIPPLHG